MALPVGWGEHLEGEMGASDPAIHPGGPTAQKIKKEADLYELGFAPILLDLVYMNYIDWTGLSCLHVAPKIV